MSGPGAAVLSFPSPPLPFTPFWGASPWARRRPPRLLGGTREFSAPPPRPSPPGQRGRGGPGGPAAASAQRKLYPNKISSSFPIVTVPGQVAQDGQKLQPAETQEEEKTVSGATAAASTPAARKRPGWLPGGATLSTASSSVPRRAFRSCRLSPKEEGSQSTLSAPPLVSEA